jgi:hypothetical protein
MWKRLSVVAVLVLTSLVAPSGTAAAAPCTVAAVGDVAGAGDYQEGANRTARLVASTAVDTLFVLGDLAYDSGTLYEFNSYYDPGYGPLKAITKPIPGNHEYKSQLAGYKAYFDISGASYGFDVCSWFVIAVNQYAGIQAGVDSIREYDAAHPDVPLIVMWHEPRWSSGEHGSLEAVQPLWQAAVAAGARIVLNGHDHHYERFAPMTASGAAHPSGTFEFVSGLGGHKPRGVTSPLERNSADHATGTPGVLFLQLHRDGSFGWTYRDVNGAVGDSGQAPPG